MGLALSMFRFIVTSLATCAISGLVCAAAANATLTVHAAVGGRPTEGSYVNFDALPLGSAGGSIDGITVAFTGDAQAVQGSLSGKYAEPYLSNSNGMRFGDPNDGPDTTTYLSTGIGTVTMTLPRPENDLGLLWGSVDAYNSLDLYEGTTLVGSLTGADVTPNAGGDQGINGTFYVNVHSTLAFDTVEARSSGYAFEIDNFAFDAPVAVPEPTTIAVLGIGLIGLGWIRRKLAECR